MQCTCLLTILTLALGMPVLRAQTSPSDSPQVDLTEFSSVERQQVQEAYEAARANPRDASASGKVGMLLDVYKRRESAATWYKRANQLDPEQFRWLYYLGSLQSTLGKRAEATET